MYRVAAAVVALGSLAVGTHSIRAQMGPGQEVVVNTTSDASNGDISSVSGLLADPGPDGISLREAIQATNNDPGLYTVRFATPLSGQAVTVSSDLPPLTGGGLTIEGDIDGDGKPNIALRTAVDFVRMGCPSEGGCGLHIASSGNRLHALTLEGFGIGVLIQPWKPGDVPPINETLADNAVSGLFISGIDSGGTLLGNFAGVWVTSWWGGNSNCGADSGHPEPCQTYDTWENTTIAGNVIEGGNSGVVVHLTNVGDRADHFTITDNMIKVAGLGIGVGFQIGSDATGAHISDGLIARNSIEGSADAGIDLVSGERSQSNTIERVQVLDNRIDLVSQGSGYCCKGINVGAGNDAPWAIHENVLPLRYPDYNATRNVVVRGNTISGTLVWGVSVHAGTGAGGSYNAVQGVQIQRNVIRSTTLASGVFLWTTGGGPPIGKEYATSNRISDVTIRRNRIAIGKVHGSEVFTSGIRLVGGGSYGRGGRVREIRIRKNRIKTSKVGIHIIGGFGSEAHGNSVRCVSLAGNRIKSPRRAVSVVANALDASGNRASLKGCGP
jgi:hypothetical protein